MFCANSFVGTLILYISLSFSLLFIYRYIILCKRPTFGHLITNRNIVIVLCLAFLAWLLDYVLALNAGVPVDEILAKLNKTDPGVYFDPNELFGNDFSSLNAATVCVGFTALVCFLSYGIVIFCAKSIISALNKQVSSMSKSTREGYLSLTRALIVQALLPMVSFVPSLVNFIIKMFFPSQFEFENYLGYTLLLLMTICDPLLTILFVRPYRIVIFPCFSNKVSAAEQIGLDITTNVA
jgi:putative chemoreceptor